MTKTNSLLLAGVLSATLMTSINVNAAEEAAAAAAPASPHSVTTNVGIYTDYVFRGISYAKEKGAIQGGVDYSHTSGIYAGVWASNVDGDQYAIQGNTMEIDLYGGYVHKINDDLSLNVGFLQFYYPNAKRAVYNNSSNTTELNAAVTYKYFTLKHSYVVSDFFGVANSDGTGYTEFNANYTLPQVSGLNLAFHVGHQKVENASALDYTDFLLGVNKDFSIAGSAGWNAGVNYTTTDADPNAWYYTDGFKPGKDHVIGFIKRTF